MCNAFLAWVVIDHGRVRPFGRVRILEVRAFLDGQASNADAVKRNAHLLRSIVFVEELDGGRTWIPPGIGNTHTVEYA